MRINIKIDNVNKLVKIKCFISPSLCTFKAHLIVFFISDYVAAMPFGVFKVSGVATLTENKEEEHSMVL